MNRSEDQATVYKLITQQDIDGALIFLRGFVERHNLAFAKSEKWMRISNAVHEALLNGLIHGKPPVWLSCVCQNELVRVFVEDCGDYLDFMDRLLAGALDDLPEIDRHKPRLNGRGLRIMSAMSDKICYERIGNKNRFVLDFYLKWRVLIVDDSPNYSYKMFRLSFNNIYPDLKNIIEFIGASNGQEAIDIINSVKNNIDLIVLDLIMPKVSGLDVCVWLKQNGWLNYIPVIILTANADRYDMMDLFRLGCKTYYTKPVNFNYIHRIIIRKLKIDKAMSISLY